jgi:hypothetical protein
MIPPNAPILSPLIWDPLWTGSLISDMNVIRTCALDLSYDSPSRNLSLKDELKSELSRLQSKLDDVKKFAEEALEASRSPQTAADESKWSSEVISRINNRTNEFMSQELN